MDIYQGAPFIHISGTYIDNRQSEEHSSDNAFLSPRIIGQVLPCSLEDKRDKEDDQEVACDAIFKFNGIWHRTREKLALLTVNHLV